MEETTCNFSRLNSSEYEDPPQTPPNKLKTKETLRSSLINKKRSILSSTLKSSNLKCDHHHFVMQQTAGIRGEKLRRRRRFDEKRKETKCVCKN